MHSLISHIPILKLYRHHSPKSEEDAIIKEERVSFFLNRKKILSSMCIPSHQDAHIVGFLLSEGVLEHIDEVQNISISSDGLSVYLEAKISEENLANLHKEKTLTSGCCVGVTANFEGKIVEKFLESQNKLRTQILWDTLDYFETNNVLFKQTGCVHRAILCSLEGKIIFDILDIGRHNAVDKVMGLAAINRLNPHDHFLFVSGRLSLEMIIKTVMHEIPIVISKASTTKTAIQAAQKLGVTLIGFARDEKCNIYTHPSRILL
ncbi:formate dehydrogenase accessory sulfurtransferase FdhD [Helicobacter pametensis]|nr:formate dehydrogenase accessory sulfurtransferase FdhD [Helicobacter pametensis]